MLAADGYVLRVDDLSGGRLRLVIDAGEDACAECLVPEDVMANIVRSKLTDHSDRITDIELVYPSER